MLINVVAKNLGRLDCIPLASALDFKSMYLNKLQSSIINEETPQTILLEWQADKAEDATTEVLCGALKEIGRADLAAEVMTQYKEGGKA